MMSIQFETFVKYETRYICWTLPQWDE